MQKKGSGFINQKSQANRWKSKSPGKINKGQGTKKLIDIPQPHIKLLTTTLPQSISQRLYIGYPTWPLPNGLNHYGVKETGKRNLIYH